MQTNLNIQTRQNQLEQERIEVRQRMEDDSEWTKHLVEKEKKRRGIAVQFKNNHFKRVSLKLWRHYISLRAIVNSGVRLYN